MVSWGGEVNWWGSGPRAGRRTFLPERDLFDQVIWSPDLISWILPHYITIQFFMHGRPGHGPHLLIWDGPYRQFLHQYVGSGSSLSTIIQPRWFLSYLLVFGVAERSKSTEMSMRSWWDQTAVATELGDGLIRRENPRGERRPRSSGGPRWIMRWGISR
jgi:hypothetical protein